MKVAYIEWLDALGVSGRVNHKVASNLGLLTMCTAGLLVGEDDQVIRVAQDWWQHEDEDGTVPQVWRDVEIIPKALVVRREEWDTTEVPLATPTLP